MTDKQKNTRLLLLSVATLLLSAGSIRIGTEDWVEAIAYIMVGCVLLGLRELLKADKSRKESP